MNKLASVILPTANRRRFIPAAIRTFLSQTYENKELIILDDGSDPVCDLIPTDNRIRYFRIEPPLSLGMKHNVLVEEARGEYIFHMGDDDYYAPWRVEYQVKFLEETGVHLTSCADILRINAGKRLAWHEKPGDGRLSGGALAYRKAVFSRAPYRNVEHGEDNGFIDDQVRAGSIAKVSPEYNFHIHRIHEDNNFMGKVYPVDSHWLVPFETVHEWLPQEDFDSYFGGENGLPK